MTAKSSHDEIKAKKLQEKSDKSTASDKKDKSKKNTSLRLDKKTLKALKILAIEKETSVQKLIETLIHDYIEKHS